MSKITAFLEANPTITIGGAVVLVLLIGGYVLRKQTGTPATSGTSDLSGLSTNSSGQGIVYVPTSTNFTTTTVNRNSGNTNTTRTATPIVMPLQTQEQGTIRASQANQNTGLTYAYDQSHTQGIPIHSTPGGPLERYQPFGSTIQIAGPGVQGPANIASGGSTLWYPVVGGGYVSAFDVSNVANVPVSAAGTHTGGADFVKSKPMN